MSYRITSRFLQQESFRISPHKGIDLKMEIGEPIRTIKDGTIHLADYGSRNAGKTIFVEWEDGKTAIYGHLSKFAVKEGQHVEAGELIGYAGNTGFSTGSHLHFGLREGGEFIDPSPYLDLVQNMNNPEWLNTLIGSGDTVTKTYNFFDVFKDQSDIYGSFFQSLKLNIINIFSSIDYSVLIQHIQHFLQFFS